VKAITVWRDTRLIALLPFVTNRAHWGGLASLNMGWTTPYSMLSVPLIDRRDADAAAVALVNAMGNTDHQGPVWLLPEMSLAGPVNTLFAPLIAERNFKVRVFDAFDRAILSHGDTFEAHMTTHVSRKRRKELRRNRKRLQETGALSFVACADGPALDHAVQEFLRIEASGWKGTRGTALDCSDATRNFAKQAFGTHKGTAITRADMLLLDGKTIAVNLSLLTGRTAFTIKCAFDETYRSQSAGLLLEEDMIRAFLEGDWANRLDSATAPGHLIQSLWNGSTKVGDVLLVGPQAPLPFGLYEMLEAGRRWARSKAKSAMEFLRRLGRLHG